MSEALASTSQTSTPAPPRTRRSPAQPLNADPERRDRRRGRAKEGAKLRDAPGNPADGAQTSTSNAPTPSDSNRRAPRRRPRENGDSRGTQSNAEGDTGASPAGAPVGTTAENKPPGKKHSRRGGKFNSSLTEVVPSDTPNKKAAPSKRYRAVDPKGDDLTSKLIYELSTPPYPDCLICFSSIHPAQRTWSCSPSKSITDSEISDPEGRGGGETAQCCWTTFHLKCIHSWAAKSVSEMVEAWRARGEERGGEWRCPGCQSKRVSVPSGYRCFCGSTPEPKLSHLAVPHSCANPCSRPRVCGHSCPLSCHPGPCPPCQVTTQLPCHCGKEVLSFRCANLAPSKATGRALAELSCGKRCERTLTCGKHQCQDVCHPGPCGSCLVRDSVRCYCGREVREVPCGEGEEKECVIVEGVGESRWTGRYKCDHLCLRLLDCGIHRCSKPCHPPSTMPAPCPRSPSLVTHCPCGKHALGPSSAPYFPPRTKLQRSACTDLIPTCESICMKPLDSCDHACAVKCHIGPCPPCKIMLVRPCRCGSTTRDIPCSEVRSLDTGSDEILCDRPCGALRACGRHQCNRLCCPLASLANSAKGKGKAKKRVGEIIDEAGWHECDLPCGKPLACGNHQCELRDHRGACPSCLRSSFEEMICKCGRTILEPPIPCGTRINCHYPCARPPLPCGHPKSQHVCHEDPSPCPPCPFLASKPCACGKKTVDNVRCSQEKVSCGMPCGKLLQCGFHHCERLCHGDDCGPCNMTCGKPRKLCLPALHPCAHLCHAPAACDETEPCRAIIHISCPCGRIRQSVACGRSISNRAGREGSQPLKCTNECLLAKRNARLAEALGINPDKSGGAKEVTYSEELLATARREPKFCQMVEKSFADFLGSDKKSQVLAHMPEPRRKFVRVLAGMYRMDSQMVDQEPNRSVQLIRRVDSRIPTPLLSVAAGSPSSAATVPPHNLGKLTDLRSVGPGLQPLSRPRASPAPASTPTPPSAPGLGGGGGWRAVVAGQTQHPPVNVWGSPSASSSRPVSRSATPLRASPAPVGASARAAEDVPDNWEDDA